MSEAKEKIKLYFYEQHERKIDNVFDAYEAYRIARKLGIIGKQFQRKENK